MKQGRTTLSNCIRNPTALLFLFVSGIYSSLYGSISISKVTNYLQIEYGIGEEALVRALKLLNIEGWIIPKKKGRGWFELSEAGLKIYQEMLKASENEIISKATVSKIKSQLKNRIESFTPQYPRVNMSELRRKKQEIGWDFLIKIDEGEEDRIQQGLKELQSQIEQKYRYSYIIYSLNSKLSFVKRMESIVRKMTNVKTILIPIDRWDIQDFSVNLDFLAFPREGIDILFSAMPRAAVISIYYYLNVNTLQPCKQRWIYNRAKKYVYGDGEITSVSKIQGNKEDGNLVIFGEVNLARLCNLEIFSDNALLLSGLGTSNLVESQINHISRKMLEKLPLDNATFGEVNYDDPISVFNYLKYDRPSKIIVSGNRVVALGIAMYHAYCALYEREFMPTLVIEHIHAEKFSEGISSHNILVYSNFENKKAFFGIR